MTTRLKNWAGNYEFSTTNVFYPETVEQIQEVVRQHPKLRVLGTRHSFNSIADSTEALLSLERFPPQVKVNHTDNTVTVGANVPYGLMAQILHEEGFALPNMGSLPHISVIGACMTATHGSGDRNRNLAAAVSGLEMVIADGSRVVLSRENNPDIFDGAVVALGAPGVVVSMTLDVIPTFNVSQTVYQNLPLSQLDTNFDAIMSGGYSVSLFTDWQTDTINQVWVKRKHDSETPIPADYFGATAATRQLHPIIELPGDQCTPQLGVVGVWNQRLPHFRFDATPSAGDELQSEYFVPRRHAVDAIHAIQGLGHTIAPYLFISEIRSVAADSLWLSPCYQQDSIALHFTWKPDWDSVRDILPRIEALLAPFGARPHWGKLFTLSPDYPKLSDFRGLMQRYDPNGKFRNTFLERYIGL